MGGGWGEMETGDWVGGWRGWDLRGLELDTLEAGQTVAIIICENVRL